MRISIGILIFVFAFLIAGGMLASPQQNATPPGWAYPVNPPAPAGGAAPAAPDTSSKTVPGSTVSMTLAQTRDLFNVPDWHPDNHPSAPEIVLHGRKPDVRACGYCHLPNGQGRPENSSLAGLPAAYIVQQMADFKNGLRKSSEPKMGPPAAMLALAKAATDTDNRPAAEYFASFRMKPWIRVVEANTVPKTKVQASMWVAADGTEPVGTRIVEVPEDLGRTELRDSASGFVAYVPVGSIKKGEALAKAGQCAMCHGADLKGLGPLPGIAGRSPSYMARQLFDFKTGNRKGEWSPLMKASVEKLTESDLVNLAAYAASLAP